MKRWKVKGYASVPVDVVLFGDEAEVRAHLSLPEDAPIGPGELVQATRHESYGDEPLEIVDVQQASFPHVTSFEPEDVHFDAIGQENFVLSSEELVECLVCADWVNADRAHRFEDGFVGEECGCWDDRLKSAE